MSNTKNVSDDDGEDSAKSIVFTENNGEGDRYYLQITVSPLAALRHAEQLIREAQRGLAEDKQVTIYMFGDADVEN